MNFINAKDYFSTEDFNKALEIAGPELLRMMKNGMHYGPTDTAEWFILGSDCGEWSVETQEAARKAGLQDGDLVEYDWNNTGDYTKTTIEALLKWVTSDFGVEEGWTIDDFVEAILDPV